jgi:membrane protease YdiL (CAAX protease family)
MDSLALPTEPQLPPQPAAPVASSPNTIVFLLILVVTVAVGYYSAGRMRALGHPNMVRFYVTTILWEWFLMGYVLLGVRLHHTPLLEVTGAKWKTAKDLFRDIGIALLFWFLALIVLAVLAHLLHVKPNVRYLAPNGPLQVVLWILVSISAGICEETVFRGYLQKQFISWTGSVPAGVLLSAAAFGAGHIYQGAKSAVVVGIYGLMFGILAQKRRSRRPGMITHALHDTIAGIALKFTAK